MRTPRTRRGHSALGPCYPQLGICALPLNAPAACAHPVVCETATSSSAGTQSSHMPPPCRQALAAWTSSDRRGGRRHRAKARAQCALHAPGPPTEGAVPLCARQTRPFSAWVPTADAMPCPVRRARQVGAGVPTLADEMLRPVLPQHNQPGAGAQPVVCGSRGWETRPSGDSLTCGIAEIGVP